jgi:hypothetical protein
MGEITNAYRILIGKHERKEPFWRSGRMQEDGVKWNLNEIRHDSVDLIHMTRIGAIDRLFDKKLKFLD